MKTSFLLLASAGLLAHPAAAQQGFRFGPTVGATLATLVYDHDAPARTDFPLRAGGLAGATGRYQSAGRWGVQVAGLFVQQGASQHYESASVDYRSENNVRLNYLRVPLQATFSLRAGGRGLYAAAGPYVGLLLGGHHSFESTYNGLVNSQRGQVIAADTHHQESYFSPEPIYKPAYTFYSRRVDVGLQGGVGYRLGSTLLHLSYTLGLRNLAATTIYDQGGFSYAAAGDPYRTRGWQASLTYLLGSRG